MYMYVRIAVEEEPCKEWRGADLSACTGTFVTIVELDDGDFTCNENHIYTCSNFVLT